VLDFMHVEDAASALTALLESEVQGPVNIGSGNRVILKDVIQEIGIQIGRPELICSGARASNSDPRKLWANTERLTNEVGWAPRYDLPRGIAETIAWWRNLAGRSIPATGAQTNRSLLPT
jgi:nucleoside-diphosphate-sugar epimerase